jgi:predicted enzyme related to lactoylglutathione lyase
MEMESYEHGVPSWVDLSTSDLAGALDFYGALLDWESEEGPPEAGGYRVMHLRGRTVAGIGPQMNPDAPTAWATYVNVDSADAAAERVEANGGRTLMAPMDVMGQGHLAVFADPQGAVFGVWQPGAHKGAQLVNEPGAWCWSELLTSDVEGARAFYTAVFGWGEETAQGQYTMWQVSGRPVGGMMAMPDAPPHWGVYFMVADLDAALGTIRDRGGQLAGEAIESPAGRFAPAVDPAGARFSPIQAPG